MFFLPPSGLLSILGMIVVEILRSRFGDKSDGLVGEVSAAFELIPQCCSSQLRLDCYQSSYIRLIRRFADRFLGSGRGSESLGLYQKPTQPSDTGHAQFRSRFGDKSDGLVGDVSAASGQIPESCSSQLRLDSYQSSYVRLMRRFVDSPADFLIMADLSAEGESFSTHASLIAVAVKLLILEFWVKFSA